MPRRRKLIYKTELRKAELLQVLATAAFRQAEARGKVFLGKRIAEIVVHTKQTSGDSDGNSITAEILLFEES